MNDENRDNEVAVPNRILRFTCDARDPNSVATPRLKRTLNELPAPLTLQLCTFTGLKRYRSLVMRASPLAQHRSDVNEASTHLAEKMREPRERVRLDGHETIGFFFVLQDPRFINSAHSNPEAPGCVEALRSTSGLVLIEGIHVLKTQISEQSTVALSVEKPN